MHSAEIQSPHAQETNIWKCGSVKGITAGLNTFLKLEASQVGQGEEKDANYHIFEIPKTSCRCSTYTQDTCILVNSQIVAPSSGSHFWCFAANC